MSSLKLLFLPPLTPLMRQLFPPEAIERLGRLAELRLNETGRQLTPGELRERLPGIDVCVTGWGSPRIDEAALEAADRLTAILHSAGTVKPYICDEAFRRGIIVTTSNGAMSRVTAEAALALMTIGAWNAREWIEVMRNGGWKTRESVVPGLQGKTIGIIGYGSITKALLPLLAPYRDTRILIASGHLEREEAAKLGIEKLELEELLAVSDIISLQTSLTASTKRMLDDEKLALIKPGALFVNIGRGELVDEAALMRHLKTGRFRAALDVYETEPLDPESELRNLPNVLCFPHLGAATEYCRAEMGRDVILNLEDLIEGRPPRSRVEEREALAMSDH